MAEQPTQTPLQTITPTPPPRAQEPLVQGKDTSMSDIRSAIADQGQRFRDSVGKMQRGPDGRFLPQQAPQQQATPQPASAPTPASEPPKATPTSAPEPTKGIPEFSAPTPTPEPTPTPTPTATPATPEPKPGSAEFNFKELRGKYEAVQKELESLRTQKTTPQLPQDYEILKKERDQFYEDLQKTALERDPHFQRAFVDPINQAMEDAVNAISADKRDDLKALLKMDPSTIRNKQLAELTEDMDDYNRAIVVTAQRDVDRLSKTKNIELANWKENLTKMQSTKERVAVEQAEQAAHERSLHADYALRDAAKYYSDFKTTDDVAHNEVVTKNQQLARQFATSTLTPAEQARLSVYAVKGLRADELLASQNAIIAKLQAQVKSLSSSTPQLDGGTAQAQSTSKLNEPFDMKAVIAESQRKWNESRAPGWQPPPRFQGR